MIQMRELGKDIKKLYLSSVCSRYYDQEFVKNIFFEGSDGK